MFFTVSREEREVECVAGGLRRTVVIDREKIREHRELQRLVEEREKRVVVFPVRRRSAVR